MVAAYLKHAEKARENARVSPTLALKEQYLTIATSWDHLAKQRLTLLNMGMMTPEDAPDTERH